MNDDLISREKTLTAFADYVGSGMSMDDYDALWDIVAKMPSVNPQEPKTGHWIKYSIPRCGEQHYKCTSCGYYINFGQWGEVYTKEFKFCPNCGAKMESEDKEL